MDFVTSLPVSANWKGNNYNLILVIVDQLTKIVHYVPVKFTIDVSSLAEVIIDVIMHYHGVLESIVMDQGLFFTSKFWSSLYYFLEIKRKLFITFYPLIIG